MKCGRNYRVYSTLQTPTKLTSRTKPEREIAAAGRTWRALDLPRRAAEVGERVPLRDGADHQRQYHHRRCAVDTHRGTHRRACWLTARGTACRRSRGGARSCGRSRGGASSVTARVARET
jgi:hypothetical protein